MTVVETYAVNSAMSAKPNPFPTRSSIYFQKNCITSTNKVMKKVAINGPINALRINLSSFLIILNFPACGKDHVPAHPKVGFDLQSLFSLQNL